MTTQDTARPQACDPRCEGDCCNPFLGVDWDAVRAEIAAEPPKPHRTTRKEAQWGKRRGSGGYGNRRRG